MRAVKAVLQAASNLRLLMPDIPETQIVLRAIKDVNLPKFVAQVGIILIKQFIEYLNILALKNDIFNLYAEHHLCFFHIHHQTYLMAFFV